MSYYKNITYAYVTSQLKFQQSYLDLLPVIEPIALLQNSTNISYHYLATIGPQTYKVMQSVLKTNLLKSKYFLENTCQVFQLEHVPIKQFTNQISALTKVRSLTARMFTSEESADAHCQIGNLGLATEVILNWINQVS